MPIILKPENVLDVGSDRVVDETSDESFDRAAFARRAIELVNPRRTTIAICEGATRMRVESGRLWGRARRDEAAARTVDAPLGPEADDGSERWALLAIPARASRRAIALAVAQLARRPRAYALDVLMGELGGPDDADACAPPVEPNAA
jgi:hypothetical protein